jgi:hypothetical protein
MNVIVILLALTVHGHLWAQASNTPKDFKLIYSYDAGMQPLRENLVLYAKKGRYTAFEEGNNYQVDFSGEKESAIEQLHQQLEACGFYTLKLSLEQDAPLVIAKNKGNCTRSIYANGLDYFLNKDDLNKMSGAAAAVGKKAFQILSDFSKTYRQ